MTITPSLDRKPRVSVAEALWKDREENNVIRSALSAVRSGDVSALDWTADRLESKYSGLTSHLNRNQLKGAIEFYSRNGL